MPNWFSIRHSTFAQSSFITRQVFSPLTDEQGTALVIACGLVTRLITKPQHADTSPSRTGSARGAEDVSTQRRRFSGNDRQGQGPGHSYLRRSQQLPSR